MAPEGAPDLQLRLPKLLVSGSAPGWWMSLSAARQACAITIHRLSADLSHGLGMRKSKSTVAFSLPASFL